jgi:hypothetical protein
MTTISPPALDQRLSALARAHQARSLRAALKTRIHAEPRRILAVIENPPAYAASMRVEALLLALPAVGEAKLRRITTAAIVAPHTRLSALTERQRSALSGRVDQHLARRGQ